MKRVDERDTMFARANYKEGTEVYEDYYKRNPDKKVVDDIIRAKPQLCSEGTSTYDKLNSPMASSAFEFLQDINHLSDGPINPIQVKADKKTLAKRIKGLAKQYGAKLVGITELKDYHLYTHRGRHEEVYGDKVILNHKYGIAFAVEMDKDMINRGPMISEIIETSKGYVDAAVIGMIISYYIRSLGYEARNHMDANYLLMPVLVARDAGLGEIGRNTILTTKEYGSRIRLGVVSTNLELESDEPISFGLESFCKLCKNCSYICPTKSLSDHADRETDGNLNWAIKQETCYIRWRYVGTDCGMCISSCPFSQDMESIKNIDTFKDNPTLINKVLSEFREKYGYKPVITKNADWLL